MAATLEDNIGLLVYSIYVAQGKSIFKLLPYTGKFLWSQIFTNWSKIRCEPYKLFNLCV